MESRNNVRILLVDDEPALTRLMQTYLARMGYTVDTSLRAGEALALFDADPEGYKLVVADITLPDMPGSDMAVQMADRNPNLRILLCSGYPFAVDSLPERIRHRFASLQKPFLPNMLAEALEQLLQRQTD
jgi:DNA-binding NtrC family response regulator